MTKPTGSITGIDWGDVFIDGKRLPGIAAIESASVVGVTSVFRRGALELRGLEIKLLECTWSQSSLSMRVSVPDRNNGSPLQLSFTAEFPSCYTDEDLACEVTKTIANIIAHEVAEMLFVRGVRFDPHSRPLFFSHLEPIQRVKASRSEDR